MSVSGQLLDVIPSGQVKASPTMKRGSLTKWKKQLFDVSEPLRVPCTHRGTRHKVQGAREGAEASNCFFFSIWSVTRFIVQQFPGNTTVKGTSKWCWTHVIAGRKYNKRVTTAKLNSWLTITVFNNTFRNCRYHKATENCLQGGFFDKVASSLWFREVSIFGLA